MGSMSGGHSELLLAVNIHEEQNSISSVQYPGPTRAEVTAVSMRQPLSEYQSGSQESSAASAAMALALACSA